ncbi:hypothetical protein BDD12DRAFT_426891 [Trichophaea hybrida]|nr:hypothetical protein BDD12DRAFT_426891 [Trichophaea hybrida]
MHTVSTVSFLAPPDRACWIAIDTSACQLCATSTVGIAACGFALALPHYTTNDHLPNLPVNFNTNTPPLLEEPLDGNPNEAKFAQFTPTSACIPPPLSRPSTSRRWLRRLSESFSSSPTSSLSLSSPSSTVSSTSSRTRSWTTSQPSSRPPTRNKLVKRSPTERLSRANSPVPPPRQHHRRRPSTAIYQPPICEQSNHSPPSKCRDRPHQVSNPPTFVRPILSRSMYGARSFLRSDRVSLINQFRDLRN